MFSRRTDPRDELLAEVRGERDRLLEEVKALRARNLRLQDDLLTAVNPTARMNIHSARVAEDERKRGPALPKPPAPGGPDVPAAFLDQLHDHADVRALLGADVDWQIPPEALPTSAPEAPPQDERPPPAEPS